MPGPTGPAAWTTVAPWAASAAYTIGPPASVVTYNGGTYVCTTAHTAGATFDGTKWAQVAAPGATGATGASGATGPTGPTGSQATYAADTIVGNNTGSTAVPTGLTPTQTLALLGLNSTGAVSFRNRLRNGNFAVNQRATGSSSASYSAGTYILDGWKAGSSGVTLSFAAAASGDVTVTITAGSLVQIVEGTLYLPEGGAYVLSGGGTAQARAYQGGTAPSYAALPIVLTGLTAGTNLTVEISTGTATLVQLEPGSAATVFERRDDDLRRCLRYFEAGAAYVFGGSYTSGAQLSTMAYLVPKRTAPNMSTSITASSNMSSTLSNTVISNNNVLFYAASTTTTSLAYIAFTFTASAEL